MVKSVFNVEEIPKFQKNKFKNNLKVIHAQGKICISSDGYYLTKEKKRKKNQIIKQMLM